MRALLRALVCGALLGAGPAYAADIAAITELSHRIGAKAGATLAPDDAIVIHVRALGRLPDWFHVSVLEGVVVSNFPAGALCRDRQSPEECGRLVDDDTACENRAALRAHGATHLLFIELSPSGERVDPYGYVYDLTRCEEQDTFTLSFEPGAPATPVAPTVTAADEAEAEQARIQAEREQAARQERERAAREERADEIARARAAAQEVTRRNAEHARAAAVIKRDAAQANRKPNGKLMVPGALVALAGTAAVLGTYAWYETTEETYASTWTAMQAANAGGWALVGVGGLMFGIGLATPQAGGPAIVTVGGQF